MTIDELNRALAILGGDPDTLTIYACRLSITNGISLHEAAHYAGITHSSLYRKMAELRAALALPMCEACGQKPTTPSPTEGRTSKNSSRSAKQLKSSNLPI